MEETLRIKAEINALQMQLGQTVSGSAPPDASAMHLGPPPTPPPKPATMAKLPPQAPPKPPGVPPKPPGAPPKPPGAPPKPPGQPPPIPLALEHEPLAELEDYERTITAYASELDALSRLSFDKLEMQHALDEESEICSMGSNSKVQELVTAVSARIEWLQQLLAALSAAEDAVDEDTIETLDTNELEQVIALGDVALALVDDGKFGSGLRQPETDVATSEQLQQRNRLWLRVQKLELQQNRCSEQLRQEEIKIRLRKTRARHATAALSAIAAQRVDDEKEWATVLFAFENHSHSATIDVARGDRVQVVDRAPSRPDWVKVYNPRNQETGFVPLNYVRIESRTTQLADVLHSFSDPDNKLTKKSLTIIAGAAVQVLHDAGTGWSYVRKIGAESGEGYVPSNYIKKRDVVQDQPKTETDEVAMDFDD
eukprot:SAG31_NODE_3731_length_3942_cov_2.254749_1_plen_426_part_00